MSGITRDRLMTLLGSAKANLQETEKLCDYYRGSIQTITMLIDDLRAQEIKAAHEQTVEVLGVTVVDKQKDGE